MHCSLDYLCRLSMYVRMYAWCEQIGWDRYGGIAFWGAGIFRTWDAVGVVCTYIYNRVLLWGLGGSGEGYFFRFGCFVLFHILVLWVYDLAGY